MPSYICISDPQQIILEHKYVLCNTGDILKLNKYSLLIWNTNVTVRAAVPASSITAHLGYPPACLVWIAIRFSWLSLGIRRARGYSGTAQCQLGAWSASWIVIPVVEPPEASPSQCPLWLQGQLSSAPSWGLSGVLGLHHSCAHRDLPSCSALCLSPLKMNHSSLIWDLCAQCWVDHASQSWRLVTTAWGASRPLFKYPLALRCLFLTSLTSMGNHSSVVCFWEKYRGVFALYNFFI